MTIDFSTLVTDKGQEPVIVVTISGIGDENGLWRFCNKKPTQYEASNPTYKPWLRDWPDLLSERANPLGGVAESGELSVDIQDGDQTEEDALTDKFGSDVRHAFRSVNPMTASSTPIELEGPGSASVGVGTMLYMGFEAMRVTTVVTPGSEFLVARGELDTEATAHDDDDSVFLRNPWMRGRRLRLRVGFDVPGYTQAEEREIGYGYHVDIHDPSDDLNGFVIRARNRLKYLDRLMFRRTFKAIIFGVNGNDPANPQSLDVEPTFTIRPGTLSGSDQFGDGIFFKHGNEIFRSSFSFLSNGWLRIPIEQHRRGLGGTRKEPFEVGQELIQVFLADTTPPDALSSFRYQEVTGETASRSTGTWNQTSHPVPIMLAILTSAASADDGLDANNFVLNTTGHYAMLPEGVGLGVPIDRIDVASFLQAWQDAPEFKLPHLAIQKSETGREFLNREILRPFGYIISMSNSLITCRLPRIPLEDETGDPIDLTNIQTQKAARGIERPVITQKQNMQLVASTVLFKTKTPDGRETQTIFTDSDFPAVFGNIQGFFELEDSRIEIEVPGLRPDGRGSEDAMERRALRLLFRFRRPPQDVRALLFFDEVLRNIGDIQRITHPQLVDFRESVRGWTLVPAVLTERTESLMPGSVGVNVRMVAYLAAGRFGRIAPSGAINGAPAGNVFTLHANRYTDPNAISPLPSSDAAAFAVNDVVKATDRAGADIGGAGTQIVQSIGANTLTLDGNFSGLVTDGDVIEYADRSASIAQQHDVHVYLADETDRTVGASTDEPWTYGEP